MIDLFGALGRRDRHPLHSAEAAAEVIAQLPAKDLQQRLADLAQWLESVADAPDFKPEVRFAVVTLLEQAAPQAERALLLRYFKDPRPRNASGGVAWKAVHRYWKALAAAYQGCALESIPAQHAPEPARAAHAAAGARALRARAGAIRLSMLHYEPVPAAAWHDLYTVYARCEQAGVAAAPTFAYPKERYHTTPMHEFLAVLLVCAAAPERLPPEEVDAAFRIARRFVTAARLEAAPFDDATHVVDLAGAAPPERLAFGSGPGWRYFGAAKALGNLEHMIAGQDLFLLDEDERLAAQYSPGQKVTVLRQFQRHWSHTPPPNEQGILRLEGGLSVAHGFRALCQQLPHLVSHAPGKIVEDEPPAQPETWPERDAGKNVVHAQAGSEGGAWAEVGALAAIRLHDRKDWWLAVIRRLVPQPGAQLLAEFEILSRKPVVAWLRILGPEGRMAADWESTSGAFSYRHVEAVVLADVPAVPGGPPLLVLPKGEFIPKQMCEMLHGERSRVLKLTEFLEQGRDFDRCVFAWSGPR